MAKIFDLNVNENSIYEPINNQTGSNNNAKIVRSEKGNVLYFNGTNANLKFPFDSPNVKSWIMWIKFKKLDKSKTEVYFVLPNSSIALGTHNNTFLVRSGSGGDRGITFDCKNGRWHQIAVEYDESMYPSGWLDGVPMGSGNSGHYTTSGTSLCLGSRDNDANWTEFELARFQLFDHELTIEEIDKDYQEFLDSNLLTKPKTNFEYPKPKESKEDGLVAHYNMQRVGNVLPDISGNGLDGIIEPGLIQTKEGIRFSENGTIKTEKNLPISGDAEFSIATRFKVNELPATWVSLFSTAAATNYKGFSCTLKEGKLAIDFWNYRHQVAKSIEEKRWYNVVITKTPGSINSTVSIYLDGEKVSSVGNTSEAPNIASARLILGQLQNFRKFDGVLTDLQIYDRALSDQEIKDYHNQWASQVNLLETFEFEPTDTGQKVVPKQWLRAAGSFTVNSLAEQDPVLSHLGKGTNYLEALQNSSAIAIKSDVAYGTWEWDWWKGSGTSYVLPIIDNYNSSYNKGKGYCLATISTGVLNLLRTNPSNYTNIFYTGVQYAPNEVWYRYRLTRSSDGAFTLYIKGGVFGDTWTLVQMTMGTNPAIDTTYNDSRYFLMILNKDDKIANIKIYDGVRQ